MVDSLTANWRGRTYELVLQGPLTERTVRCRSGHRPRSCPTRCRRSLSSTVEGDGGTYWRYSKLGVLGAYDREASVVVGSQLQAPGTGDTYALFYLFSMAEQQSTLDLVRHALSLVVSRWS